MNTEIDIKITDSEWEVMRVVWAKNNVTSKEIIEVLQQKKDWKPATIKTFIGRIVKKGMLHTESKGKKYIYDVNVKEKKFIKITLKKIFEKKCKKQERK